MVIACHGILASALLIAGIAFLLALDALMGFVYRTDENANVQVIFPRSGTVLRAIVVFPGHGALGSAIGRAFAPYVAEGDAIVVVNYAERGVNEQQISNLVMLALGTIKPTNLLVHGASMGGMLSKLFLDHYRKAGAPYGKVKLILDSAPASRDNVKVPSVLLDLCGWYSGGPLTSAVWAAVSLLWPQPPIEQGADLEIVRESQHAMAWVGMPAVTSQGYFIARFRPLKAGELVDILQTASYLQGTSPEDDPLVKIPDAITGWRVAIPSLRVITVEDRGGPWHMPVITNPRGTVQAMIAT
jgi:hypothetical protein